MKDPPVPYNAKELLHTYDICPVLCDDVWPTMIPGELDGQCKWTR